MGIILRVASYMTYRWFFMRRAVIKIFSQEFNFSRFNFIQKIRTMEGTAVARFYSDREIRRRAQRSNFLGFAENWLLSLLYVFPRQLLRWVLQVTRNGQTMLTELPVRGNKLILMHNFIGSKLGLFQLILFLMMKEEDSIVLVDQEVFLLVKKFYLKWRALHGQTEQIPDSSIQLSLSGDDFAPVFPEAQERHVWFINTTDPHGILTALQKVKRERCNVLMIPETGAEFFQYREVALLNSKLSVPEGFYRIMPYFDYWVSVIPYPRKLFRNRYIVRVQSSNSDMERTIETFYTAMDNIVLLYPELFYPIQYSNWKLNYDFGDKHIIADVNWRHHYLLLNAEGKLFFCSDKQAKKHLKERSIG